MDDRPGPRLSIALATCNGARFLATQLDSIARQTRPPDELIACDDASTDDTAALLERFAATAPFPVRIERNRANVGSTKNFEHAISLCTGEVIALADQDDVWAPAKLATIAALFAQHPQLGLAFSDGLLVDERLTPTGQRLWQNKAFPAAHQQRFDRGEGARLLLRYNVVTGAACAFRARLRPSLLPIPATWAHDAWIGIIAACLAEAKTIAAPLLLYRQHAEQQIGALRCPGAVSWGPSGVRPGLLPAVRGELSGPRRTSRRAARPSARCHDPAGRRGQNRAQPSTGADPGSAAAAAAAAGLPRTHRRTVSSLRARHQVVRG